MVRRLKKSARFSALPVAARAAALLERGSIEVSQHGSLLHGAGRIDGRPVRVALTDRHSAGGSFGTRESGLLADLLRRCREDKTPAILVLDSAGARLNEGLIALGAFRRLFDEALRARLAGVPMIALLIRDCFGGASMLAAVCSARAAITAGRYGMSGPAIIEALGGQRELDAKNAQAVRALFGARVRAALGALDRVCADTAAGCSNALNDLMSSTNFAPPDLLLAHRRLRTRLLNAGVVLPGDAHDALDAFVAQRPVGAADLWLLAERVLGLDPGATLTLVLDSPGQAPTRADEALMLSEYVVHAALCIAQRGIAGNEIRLNIRGEAAGGIYVALASSAARVDATPSAQVRLLPREAVQLILRKAPQDVGLDEALSAGVIDGVSAA